LIAKLKHEDLGVVQVSVNAFKTMADTRSVDPLVTRLGDDREQLVEVIDALGAIAEKRATEHLTPYLYDANMIIRKTTLEACANIRGDNLDQKLLSDDLDAISPWLDPQELIDDRRAESVAEKLELPLEYVRKRYEDLADAFGLKLSWRVDP
jgi:HEAT repeat protein